MSTPDVYVAKSRIPFAGNGLWANRDFKKGEKIVPYCGVKIDEAQFQALDDKQYVLEWKKGVYIDGRGKLGGYANMIRSSDKAYGSNNAQFKTRDRIPHLVASKRIKRDTEIFVSYGRQYWRGREQRIHVDLTSEEEKVEKKPKKKKRKVKGEQ